MTSTIQGLVDIIANGRPISLTINAIFQLFICCLSVNVLMARENVFKVGLCKCQIILSLLFNDNEQYLAQPTYLFS